VNVPTHIALTLVLMFILPVQFIEIEVAFGIKHLIKLAMTRALKFFLNASLFATANAKDEAL
jgi:hypothetical protein